jgi:hypothetical protein
MTYVDAIFSRPLMALVVFEYFADQQIWDYHQAKYSYQATAKVCGRVQITRNILTMLGFSGPTRLDKSANGPRIRNYWTVEIQSPSEFRCGTNHLGGTLCVGLLSVADVLQLDMRRHDRLPARFPRLHSNHGEHLGLQVS